uniref:Wsv035-like protein n=1 Tax=Penaeus monodon endogenous nimavirus TaxID=2133795 RepID=A0A401IPM4_9VIRU|nr:MAG: wsv035-like protein [Penaeus monodon endogenous nimavirus]GBG35557.1 wsv035-like protein [Penaeus monodon endogenous nimavirus]
MGSANSLTLLCVFTAVLVLAIVTLTVGIMAATLAKPLVTNARAFADLERFAKFKATQGVTEKGVLQAYIDAQGVARLTHTDDLSAFPPHPSIDEMSGLVDPTNPWRLPSEAGFRTGHGIARDSNTSIEIGGKVLEQYAAALVGRKISDRIKAVWKSIDAADTRLIGLFNRIFKAREGDSGSGNSFGRLIHQRHKVVDVISHYPGGHCNDPVRVDAASTEDCVAFCGTPSARRIRPPFVIGGKFIHADPDAKYCWAGPSVGKAVGGDTGESLTTNPKDHRRCSQSTGRLVLTDDGGWQCRPMFPHLFGGTDGTVRTACRFSPAEHQGERETFELAVGYIDLISGRRVSDHHAFATESTYSRDLCSASNINEFTAKANDPMFYINRPIVCDCAAVTDVLGNRFLPGKVAAHLKFLGLYRCVSNPCAMTTLAEGVAVFSPVHGECFPGPMAPSGTVNVIMNEPRSPIAGTVPALGLRIASPAHRADGDEIGAVEHVVSETRAKKLTRLASPVVTAQRLDDTNLSRNVLYLPTQKMVLTGLRMAATARPSAILHTECLPAPLNGHWGSFTSGPDPFSVAAFYVEPVADVLAGQIPQKPYEHDLLAVEALRNSRLVSGNVLGGSEMLYSTLLAQNRPDVDVQVRPDDTDPGRARLARIRRFYAEMMPKRRLSTYEHLRLGLPDDGLPRPETERFSEWDTRFRAGDVSLYSGIRNLEETFVIREGLLLRSYGAFGGLAVASSSVFNFDSMKKLNFRGSCPLKLYNPVQMAFPTSMALLPSKGSNSDIFSVDSEVLFDTRPFARYFKTTSSKQPYLFPRKTPNCDYRVSIKPTDWGLNTFRYLPSYRSNVYFKLDKRIHYDPQHLRTCSGPSLPLDIFKKSLVEWGHPDGDIDAGGWLRASVDTSKTYHNLLLEVSRVQRPMWFTAAVETANYHYRDTQADHE